MKALHHWLSELTRTCRSGSRQRVLNVRQRLRCQQQQQQIELLESRALLTRTVSVASGLLGLSGSGDGVNDALQVAVDGGSVVVSDLANGLTAGTGTTQLDANRVRLDVAVTSVALGLGTGDDSLTVDLHAGGPLPSVPVTAQFGEGDNDRFTIIGTSDADALTVFESASNFLFNLSNSSTLQFSLNGIENFTASLRDGDDVVSVPSLPDLGVRQLAVMGEGGDDTFLVAPCTTAEALFSGGPTSPSGANRFVLDLTGVTSPVVTLNELAGGRLTSANRADKVLTEVGEFIVENGEYELVFDLTQFPSADDARQDFIGASVDPTLTAYRFTEIVSSDFNGPGQFLELSDYPIINDSGEVAFIGNLDADNGTKGVFKSDGDVLSTIVTQGQTLNQTTDFADFGSFVTDIAISDSGEVTFHASVLVNGDQNRSGVFGGNGGPISTYGAPASDPNTGPNFFPGITMTDAGEVLMPGGVSFGDDLYISDGTTTSLFYETSTFPHSAIIGAFFGIDAAGPGHLIAAVAGAGPGVFHYLVTGDGGALTFLVDATDPASPFDSINTNPAINDEGRVAFIAQEKGGGPQGIYLHNGTSLTKLVDTSGPYNAFNSFYGVGLDSTDNIAFLATLDAGNVSGIFNGPDPITDKVIKVGDPLLGSVVTGLNFGQDGMNDSGELTFWASLQDGRQVIVNAEPVADQLEVSLNSMPIFVGSLQHIAAISITGSGDDEFVSVDFGVEEILSSLTDVSIDAAGHVNGDLLLIQGADPVSVTHNFAGPNSGEVIIEGAPTFAYSHLENVADLLTPLHRTFGFNGSLNNVTIGDDGDLNEGELEIVSDSNVPLLYASPSASKRFPGEVPSTSVHLGDGNDVIEIRSFDSLMEGSLLIDGDAGDDILGLHGSFDALTTLRGSDGNDIFGFSPIGAIAGALVGGPGNDALNYSVLGEGVMVSLSIGTATGVTGSFSEIENVVGGTGPDVITGDLNSNTLIGGDGNDTLRGGGGRDLVIGGNGNDSLFGQGGADTLDGGVGIDALDGGTSPSAIADEIDGAVEISNTGYLTAGGDRAIAESISSITLSGGNGNDNINVNKLTSGLATVFGGAGNDTVLGTPGNDVIYGGDGDDLVSGAAGQDFVFGDAGNDTVRGQGGSDVVGGGLGNDRIDAGIGDNILREEVDANLTLSTISGLPSLSGAGSDVFVGTFVAARLTGGASANTINASAFVGPVTLFGGDGDDILVSSASSSWLYGGSGNDTVTAGSGNDRLFGEDGNDVLSSGLGNDFLRGGLGADNIDGGDGIDVVIEQGPTNFLVVGMNVNSPLTGNDSNAAIERLELTGGSNANVLDARAASVPVELNGSTGNDTLLGGPLADTLIGSSGDDVLSGGAGQDLLDGGSGRDVVYEVANTNFVITNKRLTSAATGNETANGIEGFALVGGANANTLDARLSALAVTLLGAGGNDTLLGSNFNDVLVGGSRTVTPQSGDGTDSLDGGLGNDNYDNDPLDSRIIGSGDQVLAAVFSTLPNWLDQI